MISTETSILSKVKKHIDIPSNFISKKWKIYDAYDTKTHNEALFTPWTFIHIWSGIVLYLIFKYLWKKTLSDVALGVIVVVVHTLYEFKDTKTYYNSKSGSSPNTIWNNTFINSIGDTIGCIIGVYIGVYLFYKQSFLVTLEILVIWIIIFFAVKTFTTTAYWTKPRGSGSCPANIKQMLNPDFQDTNPECFFLWG